jgi:glycosyltransferase involved in cell wall biosynthesis
MSGSRISVLHAVTDSLSTVLMRGQLNYLRTNGFDPALLSSPGERLEQISAEEGYPVFGVAMRRGISPGRDLRSLFEIWRLLRRIKPVICNSGTPKAGLLVGLAAWLTRVPCRVYTLRGLRLETATGVKRMILTITEKMACFSAHRVVCVSASLRERAIALGLVARAKTVLLGAGSSNGVDPSRFEPTPERVALASALRQDMGIRPHQPVIGFAGRLTRDKGIPELVAAFQSLRNELPEAILLLVGDYEAGDPVPDNIKDVIESEPGIHRVGFTRQIELYYLTMDVFVLPTHREGFPNTVLEAQAAERPVVTTRATGAVDSIDDSITGLVVPVGDSIALAEALKRLLTDRSLAVQFGQTGRCRVLREFAQERVWSALADEYMDLVKIARQSDSAQLAGSVCSGEAAGGVENTPQGHK